MRAMEEPAGDAAQDRRALENRMERIKELYDWGDYARERYLAERATIQAKLQALAAAAQLSGDVEALAGVLRSVKTAWEVSEQAERNRLARAIFEDIRLLGYEVVGVKPRPEFAPSSS